MTAILETPIRQRRRYPASELFTMEPARLWDLVDQDFDILVSLVVADAVHKNTPIEIRKTLRGLDMREDRQDALTCAEGALQVAAERMAYERDGRLFYVEKHLRQVRSQFNIASRGLKRKRAHDNRQASGHTLEHLMHREQIAARWLTRVFHQEFLDRYAAAYEAFGLGPLPGHTGTRTEMFIQALSEGWIRPPAACDGIPLLRLTDDAFRHLVAMDARDQNDRAEGLYHPLVVDRWIATLSDLLVDVSPRARTRSPHVLGPLTVNLDELPDEEAVQILKSRRFFAALRQRRLEAARWLRIWTTDAMDGHRKDPRMIARRVAQAEARDAVIEAHQGDRERILKAFGGDDARPFASRATEHTYPPMRQRMLAELFPEWAASTGSGDEDGAA